MRRALTLQGIRTLLLLVAACHLAWAGEQPLTYDRINLSASASADVENDILVAVLYSQREGSDTTKLADAVNRDVGWALQRAKAAPGVSVRTLDYSTNPVYRDGKLTAWRLRQSIRLESNEPARLSTLIGVLQERLAVQSIVPDVSPSSRQRAEDVLISEAILAFNTRAKLVAETLKRAEYRLVRMDINTRDAPVQPFPARGRVMAMEATAAPPVLEPGTRKVHVTVTGTIELQL